MQRVEEALDHLQIVAKHYTDELDVADERLDSLWQSYVTSEKNKN